MANVVIWARVSSREQREGYSIDAQLRLAREKAGREGWAVHREFVVAESARRGAERDAFNAMYKWVRSNARREGIGYVLSHKLDRVCRNIRDAVRMQELEDVCGVRLAFVDNQFGSGAAGALSFNVMAAVAQYYSDNLRTEVIKGIDERARQGWPTGKAPFGYVNVKGDRTAPIQPHPTNIRAVQRIFELYIAGMKTFSQIGDVLAEEGFIHRPCEPRFCRSAIAAILDNRFYIGQIVRNGEVHAGKYPTFIDERTFARCQEIKRGRNRRTGSPDLYLAGGLFQCMACGYSMTGERVRRPFRDGTPREYLYYRCGSIEKPADHPVIRWRTRDLEDAIMQHLAGLRVTSPVAREWYRRTALSAFDQCTRQADQSAAAIRRRLGEISAMTDRLLGLCLSGGINDRTFRFRNAEFEKEAAALEAQLRVQEACESASCHAATAALAFIEQPAEIWRQAGTKERREILAAVTAKRRLTGSQLLVESRPPFGWSVATQMTADGVTDTSPPSVPADGPSDAHRCLAAVQHHPGLTAWELSIATGVSSHVLARRLPELRQRGKVANGTARVCRVKTTTSQTWIPAAGMPCETTGGLSLSDRDGTAGAGRSLGHPALRPDGVPIDGWISPQMQALAESTWITPEGGIPTTEQIIEVHRNVKRLLEVLCPPPSRECLQPTAQSAAPA